MPSDSRSAFRERLGTYLLGVAIGLILLGFFWAARYQAAQHRAQTPPSPRSPK